MANDTHDTLTNVEAKVLCMRYGFKNIDEMSDLTKSACAQNTPSKSIVSLSAIAESLEKDIESLKAIETNALRKLKINRK